jgi:hypothetical protein
MVTLLCNQYKRKCARKAKVTDLIKGVVFLPMHWGKQLDNDLNRLIMSPIQWLIRV